MALKTYDNDISVIGKVTQTGTPSEPDDVATVEYVAAAVSPKIDGLNGLTAHWAGTQTEYDAIGTKSATTVYDIYEE